MFPCAQVANYTITEFTSPGASFNKALTWSSGCCTPDGVFTRSRSVMPHFLANIVKIKVSQPPFLLPLSVDSLQEGQMHLVTQ